MVRQLPTGTPGEPAFPHLQRLKFCGRSPPGRVRVIQRRWRAGERPTWASPSLNCSAATCACNVRQAHASSTPAGHHKPWLGSTGSPRDFARKKLPRTCTLERRLPRTAQWVRFVGKNAQCAHCAWEARPKGAHATKCSTAPTRDIEKQVDKAPRQDKLEKQRQTDR